jgi:hypothetical protein
MAEMILPGTYIEVRAEGLIAAGPISISNVGIVGTAQRGRLATDIDPDRPPPVYTPASIGEARDVFGPADPFDTPLETGTPLTLVRALEVAYANGAQRVFAVRVAQDAGAAPGVPAVYTLDTDAADAVTLESVAPGAGYNGAELKVEAGSAADLKNVTFTLGHLSESWRDVPAAVAEFEQVINGTHATYAYGTLASTGGSSNLFEADASAATGNVAEGTATQASDGTNGATADAGDYRGGLALLANEDVHIIVLAGQAAADTAADLIAHCENASTDLMKRERIGVIGSDPSRALDDLVSPAQDEGRLIFVGPGIWTTDTASGRAVRLPGAYAAAAVAGRVSSLDPHVSPTNKTINANRLETVFNGTELEQLVLGRVLALESRNGSIRIVKGITSSTNTAWSQITTRRIVDYARFGVRSACDPYIGKLNNERVRQAMKSTINGFLADMVDREMLISYELEVSATRAQQIRGIAQVVMVLRPTFSIDYIRVVMNLE